MNENGDIDIKLNNNNKRRKQVILSLLALLIMVTVGILWLVIEKRPDIVFGMKDLFTPREEIVLKEYELKQEEFTQVSFFELQFSKTSNVNYNNNLWLVNNQYQVDESWELYLEEFQDTGLLLNREVIKPLAQLLATANKVSQENVYISSTYRTDEKQAELYREDPEIAAEPGMSEHQVGLAIDLIVKDHGQRQFVKTEAGKWVNNNCWKFGFIIRYPFLEKKVTGFDFEPWHIRYVGLPHSEIIYQNRLTMEEYITSLETNHFYQYKNYVFGAVSEEDTRLPEGLRQISISKDNTGRYIITGILLGKEEEE